MTPDALRTSRLLLRDWRDDDLPAFAALNADSRVMEFFPGLLDRTASDALAARIRSGLAERGFGFWAVEVCGVAPFAGFVGLSVPSFEAHFTPCVEIGWRLARALGMRLRHRGRPRRSRLRLQHLDLDEIVSFTVPANQR